MAARPKKPKANPDPYPPGWEPFLAAIKADMDDDTPRLVFADWLEENGDGERAELIRLQCELGQTEYDDRAESGRTRRADDLVNANWDRWVSGFPHWLRRNRFYHPFLRGFIAAVSMTGALFLKDGATVMRLTPIQELTLYRASAEALRSPCLSQVSGVYIATVDSFRVEALADHPDLSRLRRLFISNGHDERGRATVCLSRNAVRRLLKNPTLTGLRDFELKGTGHGNTVAYGLAAAPFRSLERLSLYHSSLGAVALRELLNSPAATSLRGLYLAGNPLGDAGVRALTESTTIRGLDNLNLSGCSLTRESAEMLAEWRGLRSVRWLVLNYNAITASEESLILASRFAENLKGFRIQFPQPETTTG